jgi:hypothetical protein
LIPEQDLAEWDAAIEECERKHAAIEKPMPFAWEAL